MSYKKCHAKWYKQKRWVKNPAYGNFSILNNDLQTFDSEDLIC